MAKLAPLGSRMSAEPVNQLTPQPRKRRLIRLVLAGLAALLVVLPLAQVAIYRFAPPPMSWLAIARVVQGRGYRRDWRSFDQISANLVYAVTAAEDARFCSHHGFDWEGIQKALRYDERHETRLRGGSTISQQTAKNVFLWPGRDWVRKGLETYYTVLIETLWGKRRIMEVYLNDIEWAPGVYGAEAASEYWFHTHARDLSSAQAAHLAAILPKPLKWRATGSGAYVRGRTGHIMGAMGDVRGDGLDGCVYPPAERRHR
jgi:monofunctional biosynthetic peptidoglycan transglycosylase